MGFGFIVYPRGEMLRWSKMLFVASNRLLAICTLLCCSAEDSTSGHFRQQIEVPCEQVTDWSGCWRALKRAPDHWHFPCLYSLHYLIGCLNEPAGKLGFKMLGNFKWFYDSLDLWISNYLVLATIVIQWKA